MQKRRFIVMSRYVFGGTVNSIDYTTESRFAIYKPSSNENCLYKALNNFA